MPEMLQKIITPIQSRWSTLARDQRIKLAAVALIVLLALVITIFFVVRTQYELFINNLTASELMPIETALTNEGIKHKRTNNATALLVDKKRIPDAKIAMESNPDIQGISFTFVDALDRNSMGTTESTRRAMMIRAKQTELQQMLTRMDGVNSAIVSLHIPENIRLFMPDENKATASALLNVSRPIEREEGMAMARLLARSVEGLELESIEIVDNQARTVFSGVSELAGRGHNSIAEMRDLEQQQIQRWVANLFIPICDEVRVVPNLDYDPTISQTETIIQYQTPAGTEEGLPVLESSTQSQVRGGTSPDEPGLGSNDQTPPTYMGGNDSNYNASSRASDVQRVVDTFQTTRDIGPGSYVRSRSSLTVYLYHYIHHFQKNMEEEDRNFTQASWDNFVSSTRSVIINDDPNLELYKQSVSDATGIPVAAITFIINEVPIFHDYIRTPIDSQFIVMMSVLALLILMLAYGLIRRTKVEEDEDLEPELSVEDLLVSTQLEEAKDEEAARLEEIDYMKESEVKKQIEKFINEKPEAVAALLRNWLNAEEW
jgi:flagellar M-ring protein FliF